MHKEAGQAICDAWVHKDFVLLRQWLAPDLEWHEGSYDEAIATADQVVERWENDLTQQTDIQVTIELLDVADDHSYHHCVARWQDVNRGAVAIDGIFMIGLNQDNKIVLFRQWWNSI